jgi:hypothetical protein
MHEAQRMPQFMRQCATTTALGWQLVAKTTFGKYDSSQLREENTAGNLAEVSKQKHVPAVPQQAIVRKECLE